MLGAFSVVTGDNRSPVIIHIPHAGLRIPRSELPSFVLSPADLKAEARRMADLDTHELAFQVRDRSGYRPWLFQNEMSRLVMDPERFPDDSEIMNQVGMGVVYMQTSDRQVLRRPDRVRDARIIRDYFLPYSRALTEVVAQRLEIHETVTIIDLHTYHVQPLRYELDPYARRPELCIGTDPFHTPPELVDTVRAAFAQSEIFDVALNTPFAGTYVPLRYYHREPRVRSVMLEIRRDFVSDAPRGSDHYSLVSEAIRQVVRQLNDAAAVE
ncbi:N-formylglutamate amidohydrolase [Microbacteriaceae bacterium MWH-Ta3]|nr:N-formylglutamate amidohydrolase [Microbacteriaceae bacterium MWH-Ta3]